MFARGRRRQRALYCMAGVALSLLVPPPTTSLEVSAVSDCPEESAGGQWTVQTTVKFEAPRLRPKEEEETCANQQAKKNMDEATEPSVVDSGYVFYTGVGFYKLHTKHTKWSNAKKICEDEGGYLAIINSREEERVIRNLIIQHMETYDFVFIGFNDIDKEGEFRTVHGDLLSSVGYVNWAKGEPNDSGGEDCGAVGDSGQLNDYACNKFSWFLCERPL